LLKDTPPARIVEAVRRVAAGDPILSPAITRRLMDQAATQAGSHTQAQEALSRLSPREYDVMLAVAQGKANADIATELYMSVATVKAHISHILGKLELGNRTQIALLAHDAGLA
jgi:DNA-binding NarL/FixJ family response regulator